MTGAFENPMYAMDAGGGGIKPFEDAGPVRADGINVENPMYDNNDDSNAEAAYQDVTGANLNAPVTANDTYLEVGGADDLTGGIA